MRKLHLIIVLLIVPLLGNAQSYNITYVRKNVIDYEKMNKLDLPDNAKILLEQAMEKRKKTRFYNSLKYINGKSIYQFLKAENASKNLKMTNTITYKDLKKSEIYSTGGVLSSNKAIKRTFNDYKWKFAKETKEILGYTCKKAYYLNDKNQKTVAWYTTKIPIMDGPSIYGGLPGLILQIETSQSIITVSKVEKIIDKTEKVEIPKFEELITYEEYRKLMFQKATEEKNKKND